MLEQVTIGLALAVFVPVLVGWALVRFAGHGSDEHRGAILGPFLNVFGDCWKCGHPLGSPAAYTPYSPTCVSCGARKDRAPK